MCLALVTLLLAVGWLSARVVFLLPYGSPAHIMQPAPAMEGQGFSKLFGRDACKSGTWCLGIVNLVINGIFLKCHGVGSWCKWNMQIQLALKNTQYSWMWRKITNFNITMHWRHRSRDAEVYLFWSHSFLINYLLILISFYSWGSAQNV